MEGMAERAHGRQRQQRGWPGEPAPSLPGARATPAQPASGGGCLPQPKWAACATGARAIRGRPAVRGKGTYGGRPGQRVEEQGTWASRTQKHSEAGYGRPVDRGAWTAKTVKRPRQQPAHPQYANYWAPLTRKRHIPPHSAQPQHTNYWALRTRKRHQQEHRPQRPTERSNPTQHAKGRTVDCPGPRKGAITRRNVTQGGATPPPHCPDSTPKAFPYPNTSLQPPETPPPAAFTSPVTALGLPRWPPLPFKQSPGHSGHTVRRVVDDQNAEGSGQANTEQRPPHNSAQPLVRQRLGSAHAKTTQLSISWGGGGGV